jgi:hypothetical protein
MRWSGKLHKSRIVASFCSERDLDSGSFRTYSSYPRNLPVGHLFAVSSRYRIHLYCPEELMQYFASRSLFLVLKNMEYEQRSTSWVKSIELMDIQTSRHMSPFYGCWARSTFQKTKSNNRTLKLSRSKSKSLWKPPFVCGLTLTYSWQCG